MTTNEQKVLAREWPEASQFKKSIRFEFSLYMAGIILVLMATTGFFVTNQYVRTVTKNIAEKLLVQARSYSGSSGKLIISTNGPDALLLNNICKKLASDNPDVYWVGIADKSNMFLAHTSIKEVVSGSHLTIISTQHFADILRKNEGFRLKNDTVLINVPIIEKDIVVGRMGIASSGHQITEARNKSIMTVASITILMILIGIPISMFLLHRKLKPISLITNGLKDIDFEDIKFDIPFTSQNEFGYLSETLRVMGNKLNVAQKDIVEKERISRELEIAREIQANILPHEFPKTTSFEFYGTYQSAKEVGGDYYDFIDYGNDYIMFLVADVSGKSLPGMLVMLITRDIIRQLARNVREPDELLCDVNRELLKSMKKGMFVTMFLGLLNKRTGEFSFASAGHNPLIKLNADSSQSELIKTNGFPLGMVPSEQFNKRIEKGQIGLSPNDWLIQYTDGINEAHNSNNDEFGMDRFVKVLESNIDDNPITLVDKFIRQHQSFVGEAEQFDDITLLAMKWFGETTDNNFNIMARDRDATCS